VVVTSGVRPGLDGLPGLRVVAVFLALAGAISGRTTHLCSVSGCWWLAQIGPRAKLTFRAINWATDALAHYDTTVSALARHLGVD
jgi:hypothetical protein